MRANNGKQQSQQPGGGEVAVQAGTQGYIYLHIYSMCVPEEEPTRTKARLT